MSPHKRGSRITHIVEDDFSDDDKYSGRAHKHSER